METETVAKLVRFALEMELFDMNRHTCTRMLMLALALLHGSCKGPNSLQKTTASINATSLDYSEQKLIKVPDDVSLRRELKKLVFFRNAIDTVPAFIGGMDSLQKLSFKSNKLVHLDSNAMDLPSLKELDLRFNRLERIPDGFGGMTDLEVLDLRNNRLKSLPGSIGALKKLEFLYLSDNDLRSLPSTLLALPKLKFLVVGRNSIEGRLPDWICDMQQLVELDVSGCCTDNRLPDDLSRLRNLELLTVSPYQVLPNNLGKGNARLRIKVK